MEEKKLKVKIRLLRAERSGKCQADNGGIHQSGVSDRTASIALKIVATERKLKQIHYLILHLLL